MGRGLLRSNVYFVRSGNSWALIDAGSAKCGRALRQAAAGLFGESSYPAAILLTHDHPDHAGSVRELAEAWDCFVWVHPNELPLVLGDLSTFEQYPGPLDRWVVLPFLHLLGPKRTKAMLERASFRDRARTFDPDRELPGLAGWEAIPTPGHTPGHTAFFRRDDRVLITGDAMVTVDLNSLSGALLGRQRVAGPPWYTTWDWRASQAIRGPAGRAGATRTCRRPRDPHERPRDPGQGAILLGSILRAQIDERATAWIERRRT